MRLKGTLLGILIWCGLGLGACAVVESPPGGPVDAVPPTLIAFTPDSASIKLGAVDRLSFTFSEKMNRTKAGAWLHFYPGQKIRKTSWHGAIRADVLLENPLPPDTVVVVEVSAAMQDAHKIAGHIERRFPLATGDSIPQGRISGSLVMADTALAGAMVELYAVPPDSVTLEKQPISRRTRCDDRGHFDLNWLPVPGGPFILKAFADNDQNSKMGDNESRRIFPDTVRVSAGSPDITLSPLELFPLDTPGAIHLQPRSVLPPANEFVVFPQLITESDSGWQPEITAYDSLIFTILDSALADTIKGVSPGLNRLILFADLDQDSSLSVIPDSMISQRPDSLMYILADSLGDTTGFSLEPWLRIEPVKVEPGLTTDFELLPQPFVVKPWPAPVDSATVVVSDSLATDSGPEMEVDGDEP